MATKTKTVKVPVTERALLQRINRALAKQGKKLCKGRSNEGPQAMRDGTASYPAAALGAFYTVDLERNMLSDTHVDVEKLAHKLGVLKAWEQLAGA